MIERSIERAMYASRWLLAPIYLGLSLALLAIGIKFFQEILHVLPSIFEMHETDLVLTILALVDMVLVSGFNVYPNEIEDVVAQLPGVMECAVVGVPDEKSGEAVKLVIVKKDASLTESQVRDFCKANLTGYKQPRVVEFRTELPKTPVGKILRRELRDKK